MDTRPVKTRIFSILSFSWLAVAAAIVLAAAADLAQAENATSSGSRSYASAWGQEGNPSTGLARFSGWAARYAAESNPAARGSLVSEGLALSKSRKAAVAALIETDPEQAIAVAVPAAVRAQLPMEVLNELETRVSGMGDLSVMVFDPDRFGRGPNKTVRTVTVGGKKYEAFVYGRRAYQGTKKGVPVHGIAIGNKLALHESPVRQAEAGELAESIAGDLRNSSEKSSSTLVEVAGKFYATGSAAKAAELESRLIAAEAGMSPYPAKPAATILAAAGPAGLPEVSPNPIDPWSVGAKQIIIIRVDFSDDTGEPHDFSGGLTYTADYVHQFTDAHVNTYYKRSSYGLTSISNVVTAVYRMPRTKLDYGANFDNDGLHRDAEAAASADYDLTQYDRILVLFNYNDLLGYGGLAEIHGPNVWINGEYDFRVVAHELGHTYGLWHANLWTVTDGNPISQSGDSVEYGDDFDTMGANFANTEETDFNMWKKNLMGWISDSQVVVPDLALTNRIYYFDNAKSTGTLALKVTKDTAGTGHYYWIGYHPRFSKNQWMTNGVYVSWGYNFNKQSDLLDMNTPGAAPGGNGNTDVDAGLLVGSVFADASANFAIQPVRTGTDSKGQYIDVAVTLPPAPPKLASQPTDAVVADGKTGIFVVGAAGTPAPTYQWQRQAGGSGAWVSVQETAVYTGTTNATLSIYPVNTSMTGDRFRCVAMNNVGATTSGSAKLTVISNDVETLAGLGGYSGAVDGAGSAVRFSEPYGVAAAPDGSVFVADTFNFTVRKIDKAGVVSIAGGKPGSPGSANGLVSESLFGYVKALTVGSDGVVYVADTGNHAIRKIGTNGLVNGVAGLPGNPGSVDGLGSQGRFNYPQGIAVDGGGYIYVADTFNHTIRSIAPSGAVTTLAGAAGKAGATDGTGSTARFNLPVGLVVDGANNLYIADSGNHVIRVLNTKTYVVKTLAGKAGRKGSSDGQGTNSQFNGPLGLTLDASGNLIVADTGNSTLRNIAPDGTVSTYSGQAGLDGALDGKLSAALFAAPASVTVDKQNNLYVADRKNETVRLVTRVRAAAQPPLLTGAKINGRVVLSWPTSAVGYVLEKSSSLSPASWVAQTSGIVTNGNNFFVTNNLSGLGGYYRLRNAQ